MIRSMTGFARSEHHEDGLTVTAEIRSYNSRNLDVVLRLGGGYDFLEESLRPLAAGRFSRGRMEMRVRVRDETADTVQFEVDTARAAAYHAALVELQERFGAAGEIRLETLAGQNGVIRPVEPEHDTVRCRQLAAACLSEALESLDAMRMREGAFLADDIEKRLERISEWVARIAVVARDLPAQHRERLTERIQRLVGELAEIDPTRIAQEAALVADRGDISEEIVRTHSHISQFRERMAAEEPAGRKLNFLVQELNRELNTMGAKIQQADCSRLIIDARSELEKIREQVQNVE